MSREQIFYKFVVEIFFVKLKELEQIMSVEIGFILKNALQYYVKTCESSER